MKRALGLLLVAMLASACGPLASRGPTPNSTVVRSFMGAKGMATVLASIPTNVPPTVVPTPVPTATVAVVATATPTDTATPAPTSTPTPGQTATATPSPTATPTPTPVTHTVRAGENLTKIAQLYGVSVADLAAANGIQNPSNIKVGQVLLIPQAD